MAAVVNGVLYNTESGLSPMLDKLSAMLGENAKFQGRQQGYEDAGVLPKGTGSQSGGILSMLGFSTPRDSAPPPAMPIATASAHVQAQDATPAGGGPVPVASPSPSGAPSPLAGFQSLIDKAQTAYGLPAGYLPRVASIESKFDPSAVSPTGAKGLFGFTKGTASQYGLADPTDVPSSVDAFGRLTADNAAALTKALGRAPTPGELYLAHQQGAAGAAALLKNPQLPAGQVLASIGADPNNVTVNGGDPSMPAGAFAAKWTSRFGGSGPAATPQGAAGAQPTAGAAGQGTYPNAPSGIPGVTATQIQALLRNPATEQIGLKLWESAATGKNYDFSTTPDGDVIRQNKQTGQADLVLRAPVKRGFQVVDGRLLSTDPQSGTASDATPAGMPQGFRPATADERKAYNVQPDAPFFFGPDGKPATLNSGVNVVNNLANNPILGGLGKQFVDQRGEADSAAKSIPMIQTARSQLQRGIFAGAGANQVLALQKLGLALGLPGADASKITNTETFSAATKPLVMQLVKNLGSGNSITDADVRFVNEAVGGEKTLDPTSLARILDITERSARNKIVDYNTLADQMLRTPGAEAYRHIAPMMHVQAPPLASAGVTKTIGGTTYTQAPDGHWYVGQ